MQKVVLDTTKVQIFKQITTTAQSRATCERLFQIPQRYRFSSKSQLIAQDGTIEVGCFRYHKGTDFQANHNFVLSMEKTPNVVLDTTKVQIFKQITTLLHGLYEDDLLFQIPQRYRFSSKSQLTLVRLTVVFCCFRYHKGTDFQANHNKMFLMNYIRLVVLDTTKVQIFKQITTVPTAELDALGLFQIPQRYRFSSKSQRVLLQCVSLWGCFRYHKGTDFQANHNHKRKCTAT